MRVDEGLEVMATYCTSRAVLQLTRGVMGVTRKKEGVAL